MRNIFLNGTKVKCVFPSYKCISIGEKQLMIIFLQDFSNLSLAISLLAVDYLVKRMKQNVRNQKK